MQRNGQKMQQESKNSFKKWLRKNICEKRIKKKIVAKEVPKLNLAKLRNLQSSLAAVCN